MQDYKHSVSLDLDKCKGCTHCLKRCPTEAIRVRDGHAVINSARCIDCGMCIRTCPHKAKKAVSDSLDKIKDFKWKIALPAPSLYGQFEGMTEIEDIDIMLDSLHELGFNQIFEVSQAAEIVTAYTRSYIKRPGIKKPVISSACPVVTRLLSLRFPFLCENVLPIISPMEIAAISARQKAKRDHPELSDSDIAVCFITPCPAKVSFVKNHEGERIIDCVVSISDIYFLLLGKMKNRALPKLPVSRTGKIGVSWAATGGESSSLLNDNYLAADGIDNVIKVLDEIDNGNFPALEFIELNACDGGCVGGTLTVENPYIAKARLGVIKRYLPVSSGSAYAAGSEEIPAHVMTGKLEYKPVSLLNEDRGEAIRKMAEIQAMTDILPDLDCGSCGAPTCQTFAYDVVKGEAEIDECVVLMREKLQRLLKQEKKTGE